MRVIVLSIALTGVAMAANEQTVPTKADQRDKGIHPTDPAVCKFAFGTPTSVTRDGRSSSPPIRLAGDKPKGVSQ